MAKSIAMKKGENQKKYIYYFFDSTGDPCRIDQYNWDLIDQHFIQNLYIFDKTYIQ